MSTWCWVISSYDFCSFWCMAVDKLQFLSFIFAVLISVTVHLTALRLEGYYASTHTKFCSNKWKCFLRCPFTDCDSQPCWLFKIAEFYLKKSGGLRYVTVPNFVEIRPSIAEILRFLQFPKMAATAISIFQICSILLTERVKRAETHQCAIFHQNLPANLLVNVEILPFFEFSRWRPSATLDLFGAYLDHQHKVLEGLYHSAKFSYDRCSSFDNMNVSTFGTFVWKTPIHAPKIGVFMLFDPLHGLQYQRKPKKAHPCVSSHHLCHQVWKFWWVIWPVCELLIKRYFKNLGLYFTYLLRSPHGRISAKFCAAVEVDVITYDNFFGNRLRDVDSVGRQKWRVHID